MDELYRDGCVARLGERVRKYGSYKKGCEVWIRYEPAEGWLAGRVNKVRGPQVRVQFEYTDTSDQLWFHEDDIWQLQRAD